jgi:hypothetical protein
MTRRDREEPDRLTKQLQEKHQREDIAWALKAYKDSLLSEASLAEDWDRPEEDEAWRHLQEEE